MSDNLVPISDAQRATAERLRRLVVTVKMDSTNRMPLAVRSAPRSPGVRDDFELDVLCGRIAKLSDEELATFDQLLRKISD
jgi:hypothetical protein